MTVFPLADLTVGVCRWLHDAGFGVYSPDAALKPQDRVIVEKLVPPNPDWALTVAPYSVTDEVTLPNQTVMMQLRFRAPADQPMTAVDDWADAVADALNLAYQFEAGDVKVARARRTLVAPLGVDDNGRMERADSYEFIVSTI